MESIPKPLKYFIGNPATILSKEEKYHSEKLCLSIKVIDFEINKVIDPVITNSQLNTSIKERLIKKKTSLRKLQEVFNYNEKSNDLTSI